MSGLKSLKKRRRIQVLGISGACVAMVMGLLWFLPDDSFQFFRSPTELAASPPPPNEVFKVGGLIVDGSIEQLGGVRFNFALTDGGATVKVSYVGDDLAPDLVQEGQGTIATGRYVDGIFLATEILARHDEDYIPIEVINALEDQGVYLDPDGAAATN